MKLITLLIILLTGCSSNLKCKPFINVTVDPTYDSIHPNGIITGINCLN